VLKFLLNVRDFDLLGTGVAAVGTGVVGTGVAVAGTGVERGRGPRIAVIDSGVHAAHPHVQHVAGGIGVDDHGHYHDDYVDRLGHGTAVTAVIREKAPDAEIWAIKVFDRELTATGPALVSALEWARTHEVDLINLSLGTTNTDHEHALAAEVAHARDAGIIVVCAGPREGCRWLPGALPRVIRVVDDMTLARDVCEVAVGDAGDVTISASGYPRPIPGVPPERNLKGISFAVANVTGMLSRAWPAWPDWCTGAR
jgi:subtilisin family serine protease